MDTEKLTCEECREMFERRPRARTLSGLCLPCVAKRKRAQHKAYLAAQGGAGPYLREWRARNPGKKAEYNLRYSHGLSSEEFAALLAAQGDVCAICGRANDQPKAAFAVDHDHSLGCHPQKCRSCDLCRRGILCSACNGVLGRFHDDPDRFERAAAYLRRGCPGRRS